MPPAGYQHGTDAALARRHGGTVATNKYDDDDFKIKSSSKNRIFETVAIL
jgi:hypothetical protein